MLGGLRRSFAAKMVALVVGTIILVSISVAALLIAARLVQTRDLEQKVASGAVDAFRSDLNNAGRGAASLSQRFADYPPLVTAYQSPNHDALSALFASEAGIVNPGESLVALGAGGHPILGRSPGQLSGQTDQIADLQRFDNLALVQLVQAGGVFPQGYIDQAGNRSQVDTVAAVKSGGTTVGYVLYSIDLETLLRRLVPKGGGLQYSVFYNNRRVATTLDSSLLGQAPPNGLGSTSSGGQFGTYNLAGHTYAGYYGPLVQNKDVVVAADVDNSVFAAQQVNDALVVLFATTVLATLLSLFAVSFARRFALKPLAELGKGAARVGSGDYTGRVDIQSKDELGGLAQSFNLMSERILDNTLELESQRARLDASITSLSAVSRALTTTTAGERALRNAVLDALSQITGATEVAMYSGVQSLRVSATRGLSAEDARSLLKVSGAADAVAAKQSRRVGLSKPPAAYQGYSAVVVPMIYQERPVGALVAFSPDSMEDVDIPSINVLANQASVALQNSVLFQREHETVVRLQELDALKSDFLATIQHELRTPLTAIIGMTDLLDMAWQTWGDEQKLDAVSDVQLAAKGLYELVETVLDYSMIESERLTLTLAPTPVRAAADAAVADLTPLIKRSGVKIDVKVPDGLKVEADSKRLTQVMKALLDNAVKFSPEESRVELRGSRKNGKVMLEVVDKGIGIDAENQSRIFERFYQVDNTATRRYGGTGMGLALVRKLVEMQKGLVEVKSTPGKGSTFTVSLPASK